MERVSSFKYLGVNISEDLTWTTHMQTQVKKARQRLYHLRQLRKFRVSPAILKTFYSGAIESVLTQCISVWYGNSSNQDCKALQRVVRFAERISGSALPSLQDIFILLHILLFISLFYLYICSCVVLLLYNFLFLFFCTGPDLIYISLLIIPWIIYYVTNKQTLNLEP